MPPQKVTSPVGAGPPWAKPPLEANARAKGYLPWAKPPLEANARAKGYLPWAKPPLEANARAKGYLAGPALRQQDQSHPQRAGRPGGRPRTGGSAPQFLQAVRLWEKRAALGCHPGGRLSTGLSQER